MGLIQGDNKHFSTCVYHSSSKAWWYYDSFVGDQVDGCRLLKPVASLTKAEKTKIECTSRYLVFHRDA